MKPWAYTGWYYYGGGHEMLQEVYAEQGFEVSRSTVAAYKGPESAGVVSNPLKHYRGSYKGPEDFVFAVWAAGSGNKLGRSVTRMPGGEL